MSKGKDAKTLFKFQGTPVKVEPGVGVYIAGLWGSMLWLAGHKDPERPWPVRILAGSLASLALLSADMGHALAHVISARWAGTPMEYVLVSADMPRTIYAEDDVAPRTHRKRALGGPIYNAIGLLVALVSRRLASPTSLWHESLGWSALGHGLILAGSLVPLPIVDGGVLLKWTLVERGHTPEGADAVVRQAGLAVSSAALAAGATVAAQRRWLAGLGLVVSGAVGIAAALDKIR
ncbi:MAG: hypothetical protein M8467_07890 [Anaerolineae bacterium]|nr:hypothetical protein [Anaerolineae bacterium]